MKTKSVMLVCVVMLMLAAVISACGGSGGDNNGNEGSTPAAEGGSNNGSGEEAGVDKELEIMISHTSDPYAQQVSNDNPYIQELERLSGYKLNYDILGHGDELNQQLTIRYASGDLPDLAISHGIEADIHPGAFENDVFTPLSDLLEEHGQNILANIPESVWEDPRISKDGEIYMIPQLQGAPYTRVMYIRQDWLEQLDMDTPVTVDDYVAFFEAVKQNDMNGNGDPNDEYGFYVRENLVFSDVFFHEFGAYPDAWYEVDGELIPGVIKPEMKDALAFWKMLYDEGYINPNLFTNKSADWIQGIYQGLGGSWKHSNLNATTTWAPSEFANENARPNIIDGPTGPNGKGMGLDGSPAYHLLWTIPSNSEKAVEAIQFLDWAWSSEEAANFFAFGIEGENYTVENGEINWDPDSSVNAEQRSFYELHLNPTGDWRNNERVLEHVPNGELVLKGLGIAKDNVIPNLALNMPVPEGLATNPDLGLNPSKGGLFFDMFAQVITGREELEPAFEQFVSDWRSRGGDEVIAEATQWYQNNK